MIRKPRWWPWQSAAAVAFSLAAVPAFAQQPSNPLDWHGPEFLCLYLALLAVAVVFAVWGRQRFKGEGCAPSQPLRDPFDLAVMAKGPGRMVETALAMLSARGGVVLEGRKFSRVGEAPPKGSTPLEAHVWNALWTPLSVDALHASYAATGKAKIADLRRAGLVPDKMAAFRARLSAFLPLFALAGLGAAKVCVGLARGKPVEFLVILAILTVVLSVVLASLPLRRTRQGDAAFAEAESACHADRRVADARWDAPAVDVDAPGRLGWQVALMGGSALALLGMSDLNRALYPPQQGGDGGGSSCGGGGDGGGGDSGGGGGCGGCGGGGGD